jgi:hypothetical protein
MLPSFNRIRTNTRLIFAVSVYLKVLVLGFTKKIPVCYGNWLKNHISLPRVSFFSSVTCYDIVHKFLDVLNNIKFWFYKKACL